MRLSWHVARRWIENDLKSVDRSKTPWLLVGVHRMFYCDSSDYRSNDDADQTLAARMRDSLEDLFNEYKVCSLSDWHTTEWNSSPAQVLKDCDVPATFALFGGPR